MRQGLFPICIVCAVTAASSRKNFDKPSIATEKSFCNSKGVHSSGKQCLRIYKDHFALQNACWEIPNPFRSAPYRCRLRVFAKRSFSTLQECAAITELRRSVQPSRKRDDRKNLAVVCTTAPLAEIMKKAPKNFYTIGKFIIAMLLQHYSADAILK